MAKLEKSTAQVAKYMAEQNHELLKKQELRKLREEDIARKQIREKRKVLNNKESIIQKEQNDEKLLKTIRNRE